MSLFFLTFISTITILQSAQQIVDYIFFPSLPDGTEAQYADAKAYCESIGSSLAIIKTPAMNEIAYQRCQQGLDRPDVDLEEEECGCWLGLERVGDTETFKWIDGSTTDSFNNFAPGEPNNDPNGDNPGAPQNLVENCGHIFTRPPKSMSWVYPKMWNDITCEYEKYCGRNAFLCNRFIDGPKFKDYEYFLLDNERVNFKTAKEFCENKGLKLATIFSESENDLAFFRCQIGMFNSNFAEQQECGCWMDLVRNGESDEFKWGNGIDLSVYSNFAPNEPNNDPNGDNYGKPSEYVENCGHMWTIPENRAFNRFHWTEMKKWNDITCDYEGYCGRNAILCEKWVDNPPVYSSKSFKKLIDNHLKQRTKLEKLNEYLFYNILKLEYNNPNKLVYFIGLLFGSFIVLFCFGLCIGCLLLKKRKRNIKQKAYKQIPNSITDAGTTTAADNQINDDLDPEIEIEE